MTAKWNKLRPTPDGSFNINVKGNLECPIFKGRTAVIVERKVRCTYYRKTHCSCQAFLVMHRLIAIVVKSLGLAIHTGQKGDMQCILQTASPMNDFSRDCGFDPFIDPRDGLLSSSRN